MDQGADRAIGEDQCGKRQKAEGRIVDQQGGADAADEAHEGADRQVEVVHRDDEHLRDGGERDRHAILQHQVQAEIAHRHRLLPEGGGEQDGKRQKGQGLADEAAVDHAACSAKEA